MGIAQTLVTSSEFDSPEVEEAAQLLRRIQSLEGTARALGGIGVALRCQSAEPGAPLARKYGDLDLATDRRSARVVSEVVARAGYEPSQRFNAAHGRSRLLFVGSDGRHVDVFIETFSMCHVLPLKDRLSIHPLTLSLADLLLTKLQIAELNRKDVIDVLALLIDHPVTEDESGINGAYVGGLLSGDWGWWRTVTENMAKIGDLAPQLELPPESMDHASANLRRLDELIADHPKSLKWRMRARMGDRVPWRDEPEELEH